MSCWGVVSATEVVQKLLKRRRPLRTGAVSRGFPLRSDVAGDSPGTDEVGSTEVEGVAVGVSDLEVAVAPDAMGDLSIEVGVAFPVEGAGMVDAGTGVAVGDTEVLLAFSVDARTQMPTG